MIRATIFAIGLPRHAPEDFSRLFGNCPNHSEGLALISLENPQMNDEFLSQLEDQLLGMTARPSLRQRLSTSHVPVSSIPKIVRRIGIRGLIESVRNSFVDTRSLYEEGRTIPHCGTTMIGRKRLQNIRYCIEQILRDDIPGDFIETGVW